MTTKQTPPNGKKPANFDELHDRYRVGCVRFAYSIVGDMNCAEDVVQDALIKLHQHLPRLDPTGNIKAWLYTVVRNHALAVLREKRRGRLIYTDINDAPSQQCDGLDVEAWASFVRKQRLAVMLWVRKLPRHRSRRVLLLRLNGYDYDRICGVLQISRCNAHTLYYRAAKAYDEQVFVLDKDDASRLRQGLRDWVDWSGMWRNAKGFRHPLRTTASTLAA